MTTFATVVRPLGALLLAAAAAGHSAATTYVEDFSSSLANWTPGPSHLVDWKIDGGELFIKGWGHKTGSGGWGVLQFNPALGSAFTASWTARVTDYKYANFALFADPWSWDSATGYATHGQIAWLDISESGDQSHFDLWSSGGGTYNPLVSEVVVSPDIDVGDTMTWQITKNAASLKVRINGQLVADVTDPAYAASNMKLGLSFGEDSQGYFDNLVVTTVPEPQTWAMGVAGLAALAWASRRRRNARAS